MINVDKKDGESNESMMRRFSRKFQGSGVGIQTKKRQFRNKKPNKRAVRVSAQRRRQSREEHDYLIKIGKLVEATTFSRKRKS